MAKGLKNEILKLRRTGKTYNEIVNELRCSKSIISYHCSRNGLENIGFSIGNTSKEIIKQINEYYLTNTLKATANKFNVSTATVKKYCENKRVILSLTQRRAKKVESVIKRRRRIKEMAIEYKGGGCVRCGYHKCVSALEFHHVDPNGKDFSIGKSGHCTSWEKVKAELDKCILVCSNCHREIHEELRVGSINGKTAAC